MLAELTRDDAALGQLYAARRRTIERAQRARRNRDDERHRAGGDVQQQALQALERGDVAAVNALAEAMLGKVTGAADRSIAANPQLPG